jgi:dTDP-glucose pyrophosphorylase
MSKDISQFKINVTATIREAMKQLDITAEKILFVIDNLDQLFGTLTDGDIRRWILNGGALDKKVDTVCNKNPFFIFESYTVEDVKNKMLDKKINCVPIVDEKKVIKKLLFWNELFDEKFIISAKPKLNIPAVIMAGGKGTRLDPFTKILPKPLIPIGNKTIIEIILDKFAEYQIKRFYLSVNHKAKIIKSYFEEIENPYNISFIEEDRPLGTAGSLKFLENKIEGNFFLTNCDIIINSEYDKIFEFHKSNHNDITLVASMKHFHIPYGVCEIENGGKLIGINEKPEYNFLVNTGMYILKSETLRLIPDKQFFHMTHLIEKIQNENGKVGVFPVSESSWIDVGEWGEYKKALEVIKI